MEATSRRWRGIYTPSSRCVGRPKFDFRTACDVASVSDSLEARTSPYPSTTPLSGSTETVYGVAKAVPRPSPLDEGPPTTRFVHHAPVGKGRLTLPHSLLGVSGCVLASKGTQFAEAPLSFALSLMAWPLKTSP